MRSLPFLLVASLSSTLTSFAQSPSDDGIVVTLVPPSGPPPPPVVIETTINNTIVYTCPVAPTVFVSLTEYIPVIETATQPVTVYQTVISTTIITSTQLITETATAISLTTATAVATVVSATTATETGTIIVPTTATLTATEALLIATTTQRVTSVTLCPTRLVNPGFTALSPFPTDWTWGCPPGWLCKPTRVDCNWEFGLPDQDFICTPNHCIPAEELPASLPTWDETPYGNSSAASNPGLTVQAIDSYFMMAPGDFGLGYDIFVVDEVLTLTSTTIIPPSPTIGARQAQTSVPGACYPWCNNCLLEAQANGKTPALCVPGSAFVTSLQQCEDCIEAHRDDSSAGFVQIAPQFQQFLDYCDTFSTVVVTSSVSTRTTNADGSTATTMLPTTATTVTSRSAAAPSTSTPPPPPPLVSTVVTTQYSETTVAGPDWAQVTIILGLDNNSTTTIYGSNLTGADAATLVLPLAQTTQSYITTLSGRASTAVGSGAVSSSSSSSSATAPSTFTGAAQGSRQSLAGSSMWRNLAVLIGLGLVSLAWAF